MVDVALALATAAAAALCTALVGGGLPNLNQPLLYYVFWTRA